MALAHTKEMISKLPLSKNVHYRWFMYVIHIVLAISAVIPDSEKSLSADAVCSADWFHHLCGIALVLSQQCQACYLLSVNLHGKVMIMHTPSLSC